MLKIRLKLRTVAAIVACLAVTAMFSGCGKDDKPDNTTTPGNPDNLTATAGDEQVALAWIAPADDGGAAITGYEISYDNWTNKVTKTASERSHTFTGLFNGVAYTFRVRAVNAKGAGVESSTMATPTAAATAPGAIENLTATAGDEDVVLAWNAPVNDGGAAITGYEITADNWANKVTKTAGERSHTFTGLTNDAEYTFQVRAVNAKGAGPESATTATPTATVIYNSITADGVKYALFIEKNPNRTKSAYTPQTGDNYRLAVLQTDGAIAEYEGEVTGYTNGATTEIALEFLGWEFSASVNNAQVMTQMKGQIPSHPDENANFTLGMEKYNEAWYHFKNNPPYDYLCYIDPDYWGTYEFRSSYNTGGRFIIKGSMVYHYNCKSFSNNQWEFDSVYSYPFAYSIVNGSGQTVIYGAKNAADINKQGLPSPGVFINETTFRHAGFDYIKL